MNIEKGKISDSQLMFLIASFTMGSATFVSFADTLTKYDTWFVIISAYVISLPFVISYILLIKRFPGKNMVQINDIIYGPYLGKLMSILYIIFVLMLFSLDLKGESDFYAGLVMPETPNLLFLIVTCLTCAYAVKSGIESIARISFAISIISALIVVVSFILLINIMDFSNFLPVLETPTKALVQGTHTMLSIQPCGILAFLMVMPNLNGFKDTGKYTLLGLAFAAFILLTITVRNTAVLGPASPIYFSDSYQSFRLIDIGNVLTKMDLLFVVGLTTTIFIRTCVQYYAVVTSISQLLKLRTYHTLIIPVGCLAICISLILFVSVMENTMHAARYHAIITTPFELIIPPMTLLIAWIRKLPKKKEGVIE